MGKGGIYEQSLKRGSGKKGKVSFLIIPNRIKYSHFHFGGGKTTGDLTVGGKKNSA